MLVGIVDQGVEHSAANLEIVNSSGGHPSACMQPTAAATLPTPPPPLAEMDLQAMQSMDWLFKKERIYLLAQFWQQRATLAEKEVSSLKEQLSSSNPGSQAPSESKEPGPGGMEQRTNLETELQAKDKEINQLVEEVQRLQRLQESSMTQISRLEEQLEHKRQHIVRLEAKLEVQKDYDELKREVSILRSIDLSSTNLSDNKSLELLLERTRALQAAQQAATQEVQIKQEQPDAVSTKVSTPVAADSTEKSAASTPVPSEALSHPGQGASPSPSPLQLNGNPKSPEDNNNIHSNNNNMNPLNAAAMLSVNNFLRNEDSLKSPYRFDDHRSPFRFSDEFQPMPGAMVGRLGESLIPKGDPMEARLQEMLRYNMDKYANQNLDTLNISRRVRELLSIHNIGQRLFAKYILGLSQGTVSELLSKPKPWDKLTEKGRDSYRKMHAWACDDNAVMLLKSLIPKKGKDSSIPPFGRPEPDITEERIAHILSEATTHMMKNQTEDSRSNDDSKSPSQGQCPSPFSKDSSQNRRLKKYENDDIPQEKVVKIYQEELAKLMGRRAEDFKGANPRDHFSSMFFPQFLGGGLPIERTPDELRMVLETYHRELAKLNQMQSPGSIPNLPGLPGLLALQQQALQQHHHQQQQQQQGAPQGNGGVQDLSMPKEKAKSENGMDDMKEKDFDEALKHAGSAFSLVRPKLEPGSQQTGSTASSPLGNSILPPAMTPTEDFNTSAAASPLQRMASITNSLISQPPPSHHPSPSQRPLKAVLPPITQQQFDLYNNLNTEDIVKKVKEQLSQYSISQRLFGESVLGLSQGSVSDLLARPKPWHMLTQKGREPFIRMKMFLEDENAVHKLVASQYKIAPEKLMRTGGYGTATASLGKPMHATPKMISDAAGLLNKMQQEGQNPLLPPSLNLGPPPQQNVPQPPPPPMLLTPPGISPHHMSMKTTPEQLKSQNQSPHPNIPHSPMSQQQSLAMRSLHQHISPSVYEMAALTQDLDTQVITTKIKEALLANNIGQKIFGEAVLGLSQGSVSELLSKPKPWHMLSIKGREPFIRMQLWLNDAHNVDRLQALKNERREANKRRRSTGPGAHDNSSDTSSNDTSEFYHSNSPGPGPPAGKKQRVLFSEEQKEALRLAFALDPYPNVATIEFLANELGLSSRTITNWFHNHRMRLKQQVPHGMPSDIPPRDQNSGQAPFDPVQFRLLLNQRLIDLSKERMGLGGVPLPYPPYFAANSNLAALISRGLLPSGDVDLSALNNAVKEQMNGLDLTMTSSIKHEPSGDFEDDEDEIGSNMGSEDSDNLSSSSLAHGEVKIEREHKSTGNNPVSQARSSRRKPAAPQWVNPEWQDENKDAKGPQGDEVIINGVCVMQTDDFGRRNSEETVRVEPQAVMDRFEDDRSDASSPISHEDNNDHPTSPPQSLKQEPNEQENVLKNSENENSEVLDKTNIKTENEDERWEY